MTMALSVGGSDFIKLFDLTGFTNLFYNQENLKSMVKPVKWLPKSRV